MKSYLNGWAEVIKLLPCAILVFLAYKKTGYYPSWLQVKLAVGSYYKEKNKLDGEVLIEYLWGFIPIGTLMCSVDKGWLPVDDMFNEKMSSIRRNAAKLGYFGKFAVIPCLQGMATGLTLTARARAWGHAKNLDQVIIVVNPKHVNFYLKMGFELIGESDKTTPGLEKAPARLMYLDVKNLKEETVVEAECITEMDANPAIV